MDIDVSQAVYRVEPVVHHGTVDWSFRPTYYVDFTIDGYEATITWVEQRKWGTFKVLQVPTDAPAVVAIVDLGGGKLARWPQFTGDPRVALILETAYDEYRERGRLDAGPALRVQALQRFMVSE